ncbi:dienelactone hydrolase family protein [Herbiconiux sp. P15]|uniref:dienelactone hydrolase family protein n=1 Tax=Herbiconiux liukaitaii TaxID=3342799 RepID=UPI0035B82515
MPEFVEIPSPGWPLEFGKAGRPVVVIVHDAYGRLPYLEAYARALADQGFFVQVPDLFDGVATIDPEGATELADGLDEGFALAALETALDLGRAGTDPEPLAELSPAADGPPAAPRAGVIGLGLGGHLALRLAQQGAVDAVVAYYAALTDEEAGIIPCPVLVHRPDDPRWLAGLDADRLLGRLKEHGTPVTQHRYAGTSEGFANATVLPLLDKNAAALSFARSTYFLQAQLLD